MANVSINIITRNRKQDLFKLLDYLKKNDFFQYEIVVVDNYSTDGTPENVKQSFPEVKLVRLDRNLGIGARNVAVLNSSGKLVVFLDDDAIPDGDIVAKAVRRFANDEQLALLAFRILRFQDNVIESDDFEKSANENGEIIEFDSCGVMFKRSEFIRAGMVDKDFVFGIGESSLALRMYVQGGRIAIDPNIAVFHYRAEAERSNFKRAFYRARNQWWFYVRNFNFFEVIHMASIRYFWLIIDNAVAGRDVFSVFFGLCYGILSTPFQWKKRKVLPATTRRDYISYFSKLERIRYSKRLKRLRKKIDGIDAK